MSNNAFQCKDTAVLHELVKRLDNAEAAIIKAQNDKHEILQAIKRHCLQSELLEAIKIDWESVRNLTSHYE